MFQTSYALTRNVHTQVAERIGTSIIRGEVAPGDALPSEMRICEMLDVSRTVVREAIRMLTGKGLVESRAKSGTRVRPPEEWNYFDQDVLRWQLNVTDVDRYLAKLFVCNTHNSYMTFIRQYFFDSFNMDIRIFHAGTMTQVN